MNHTPKVLAGKLRQHIKKQQNWAAKHPDDPTAQPAAVLEHLIGMLDRGVFDSSQWRRGVMPHRLDKSAVRKYLRKGVAWCHAHPEWVDTISQLGDLLKRIEAGQFDPRKRSTPVSGPNSSMVALGDPEAINTSQIGVQSLSEGTVSSTSISHHTIRSQKIVSGVISTEDIEPW